MEPVSKEELSVVPSLIPSRCIVYAEDQPEYISLPVRKFDSPLGELYSEWQLSDEEVLRIMETKRIRLWQWTFNRPLQPVKLEVV